MSKNKCGITKQALIQLRSIPTLCTHMPLELPGHRGVLLNLDGASVVAQLQVLHVVRQEDVGSLDVPEIFQISKFIELIKILIKSIIQLAQNPENIP